MSEGSPGIKPVEQAPEAQISTKRSLSIIWVVPIIALLIGGWLAFKAWSEKGPEITISFDVAEGLEANKTKIKYKDVVVGTVTEVSLREDLTGVIVKAEMQRDGQEYLTDKTQFWVVRARVAAGEISGLGTLLSGAYIGMNPSKEGNPTKQFVGLETPPVLTTGLPGRHFFLKTDSLGSLDIGSPVYYRGIKVGTVVQYDFDERAEFVLLKIFINAPFHEKVLHNTRFWNASGINMSLDATGVEINTESLVSIMLGGVAFDRRKHDLPGPAAEEDFVFKLYEDIESSQEDVYDIKNYYLMHFDQSVRGLSAGAPVEIKGIKIGEVVNVELQYDLQSLDFKIPVLIMIEPERMHTLITEEGVAVKGEEKQEELDRQKDEAFFEQHLYARTLVKKGLRAQLKTGNLLTGQLYVDLDFYPDAPPAELTLENGTPVFPTVPAPLEQIVNRVDRILKQVEQVPFAQIGKNLQEAIAALTATLEEIRAVSGNVNQETIPRINATLNDLQDTLKGLEALLGSDSALNYNTRMITDELAVTMRSIRSLMNYLERDPQALIFGKKGDKQE